jgi:hypothetical protein
MRIYYVGRFERPHRTEWYVSWALEHHGVELRRCNLARRMDGRWLRRDLAAWKPDVVLFSKAANPSSRGLIGWCRDRGIPTVAWLWDLYWGCRRERPEQFRADLVFSTDGGHAARWAEYGATHAVLRQGIHEPEHVLLEPAYRWDVGFVGGYRGHPSRRRLLAWLRRTYGRRFIHHTHTRGLALNEALAQVRVVVGDSFPAAHYWSNRIYEVTGRGGFLLHPETAGLEAEFTDGVDYVSYRRGDWAGLKRSIDWWLAHDEERAAVRRKGFWRCGEYTYTRRVAVLLEAINRRLAGERSAAAGPSPRP